MFWKNNTQRNFKKQMKEIEKDLKSKEKENSGVFTNSLFKLRFYGYGQQSKKMRFRRMFSGGIFSIIGILVVLRIVIGMVMSFIQPNDLHFDMLNSYNEGDYSQTIDYSDRVLEKNGSDYMALLYKAKSLREITNYEEAIACLKSAEGLTEEYTENPEIYFELGNCYAAMGQHDNAISYYEKAIKINPYDSITAAEIGWEYFYIKEYNKASEFTEKAITLNNENMRAKELANELEKVEELAK